MDLLIYGPAIFAGIIGSRYLSRLANFCLMVVVFQIDLAILFGQWKAAVFTPYTVICIIPALAGIVGGRYLVNCTTISRSAAGIFSLGASPMLFSLPQSSGSREGDTADKRPAIQWTNGWRIKPDVVVSMPEASPVPAKGIGEIQSFFIPNPFKEDTWVTSIEIRPGDPSVVHHVIVQIPEQI